MVVVRSKSTAVFYKPKITFKSFKEIQTTLKKVSQKRVQNSLPRKVYTKEMYQSAKNLHSAKLTRYMKMLQSEIA